MSLSTLCLTAFLDLLSWQIGLSMEILLVSYVGLTIAIVTGKSIHCGRAHLGAGFCPARHRCLYGQPDTGRLGCGRFLATK